MRNPFRSSRLIYRAIESPEDDAFFHSISQDPQAFANSNPALLKPVSKKASEESRKDYAEKSLLGVLICLPTPSTSTEDSSSSEAIPIGSISLTGHRSGQEHHRRSNIGVNVIAAYQGQGYGSEAIEWALSWGFLCAGLHRIGIGCFSYNEGARRLYERLGFTLEGRMRESLWHDGGWHDIIEFSMLEHEWRERQSQK